MQDMPMDGDFMGDQDMPQPPQDNNQVQPFSNFENKESGKCGLDPKINLLSHLLSQVAAWYDTDL